MVTSGPSSLTESSDQYATFKETPRYSPTLMVQMLFLGSQPEQPGVSVEDKRLVTVQFSSGMSNKLINEEPAMRETKRQIKERLLAAGRWQDYLALREKLRQEGRTPRQAREEALSQLESPPPQQPEPSAKDRYPKPVPTPQPRCVNPHCARLGACICPIPQPCGMPRCALLRVCICKAFDEVKRQASAPGTVPAREHR